jgi:actin-related protein 3
MERFWSNSIFKYLRVEPEDHHFLLTEPVRSAGWPAQITSLTRN